MSGVQLEALIRAWAVQARPSSCLEQLEHVGLAAHVIDRSELGVVLAEGLARSCASSSSRRAWETGTASGPGCRPGAGRPQVDVGLLAGHEAGSPVGEPPALVEHRPASRRAGAGPGPAGWPSPWNSARWTISTPMSLNIWTKSGVVRRLPSRLLLERGHGDRHVPVAGEGVIPAQLGEAVAMGVSERLPQGIARRSRA